MRIYGINRYIDDLGRIVIPKDFREQLGIKEGDQMEICVINGIILIKKCEVETE